MSQRRIWARGITPNEIGRTITVGDEHFFLKGVEHFDGRTVLTVVTTFEVEHDTEVIVHE